MDIDWWNPPIISISHNGTEEKVDCLDLSSTHSVLSGNKFYKLWGYIKEWERGGYDFIVSMGGRHSNHLHALSYYCYINNIPLYVIVRVSKLEDLNTPTLADIKTWNTHIISCSFSQFRALRINELYEPFIPSKGKKGLWIPEGGKGEKGLLGLKKLFSAFTNNYSVFMLNVGTGTTLSSLLQLERMEEKKVIGVAPFKKIKQQEEFIHSLNHKEITVEIYTDPWRLGFGQINPTVTTYVKEQSQKYGLQLDYIYTSRLFYCFEQLYAKEFFRKEKVLLIHGGGLQGNRVYDYKLKQL